MRRLLALCAGVAVVSLAALAGTAAAATNVLTLTADHSVAPIGHAVAFTGTMTTNGEPQVGHPVDVWYWEGAACKGSPDGLIGSRTTDADGEFAMGIYADAAGTYSFEFTADELESNCVTVSWAAQQTLPPPVTNVFLCYSAFQTNPGVWPSTEAAALIKAGYWSPYAVAGNVDGGTNVGAYHLVCSLATGQAASDATLGGAGEVVASADKQSVSGLPGFYPIVGK